MDALESAWLDERVLESNDLLVVDKPVHLPVHGGADVPGSVTTRLTEYLRCRGGTKPRLGVHQRLDQETSGVLLFTRSPELDSQIAAAFREHQLSRVYCAVVQGGRIEDQGRLECRLAPLKHGRVRVVEDGGKLASTRFKVLRRVGSRAMLELRPETGRTHQLRVQLAHAGVPIVGDRTYGGALAHRLMLHAQHLGILGRHFDSPRPPDFDAALHGELDDLGGEETMQRQLRDALCHRNPLLHRCEALRLVSGWGDALPGVEADYYAGWIVLSLGSAAAEARRDELVAFFMGLGARGVYVRRRTRVDSRKVDVEEAAPSLPDAGEPAPTPLWVREGSLQLPVWLGDGLSTGLFLDQRNNREIVRERAGGKRVLNLFCYTGSFSVAAASGGASQVTSVDISGRALTRAKLSLEDNAPAADSRIVKEDVFEFLGRARRRGQRFDIVILDPPSFGTRGRRSTFNVADHYEKLARDSLELLDPGGMLLAVTNHRKTSVQRLRRALHLAARDAKRSVAQMKDAVPGPDFPDGPKGPEPSKSVWIRLE